MILLLFLFNDYDEWIFWLCQHATLPYTPNLTAITTAAATTTNDANNNNKNKMK